MDDKDKENKVPPPPPPPPPRDVRTDEIITLQPTQPPIREISQ